MKVFKRIVSFMTAAGLCGTMAGYLTFSENEVKAAAVVSLSPNSKYEINNGVFEGWGTSLCWWANRVGYSDELADSFGVSSIPMLMVMKEGKCMTTAVGYRDQPQVEKMLEEYI